MKILKDLLEMVNAEDTDVVDVNPEPKVPEESNPEIEGIDDDNLHDMLVAFLKKHKHPTDSQFHKFAESIGADKDHLEALVFKMLAAFLQGVGKHNKVPDSKFNKKELEKGVQEEMEHTSHPYIAKMIAKDHLVNNKKYYSELKKAKIE